MNEEPSVEECEKALRSKDITIKASALTNKQREKLIKLLYRNIDLFATSITEMPGTTVMEHKIDLTDTKPIRQRQYRQTPEIQKEIARQVDEMVKSGIVEESTYPWSSPVLLVWRNASG